MSKKTTLLLLFIILFFQLNLSLFGKPFHCHPDEGALLKRPLKLLLLYKNGFWTNLLIKLKTDSRILSKNYIIDNIF